MKIKFKLKKIRESKKISYRKLALLSNVSTRTIVDIELSAAQQVPLMTLLKLAKALEVKLEELYEIKEG